MLRLRCGIFAGTEVWYNATAGDITAGVAAGQLLAHARAQALSPNAYVEGYRVFDTNVRYNVRNVYLAGSFLNGTQGYQGNAGPKSGPPPFGGSNADIQQTSLMCVAYGTAGSRARTARRELFAVPDDCVSTTTTGQRIYTPTPEFQTGFQIFAQQILSAWQFRCLAVSPRYTILSLVINQAPPGLLGIVANIAGDPNIQPGSRVRIRNSKPMNTTLKLNGLWTVDSILPPVAPATASTIFLIGSTGYDPNSYDPRGTVEGISYIFCSPTSYSPQRPMGRKRGGRSNLPRGRLLAIRR